MCMLLLLWRFSRLVQQCMALHEQVVLSPSRLGLHVCAVFRQQLNKQLHSIDSVHCSSA